MAGLESHFPADCFPAAAITYDLRPKPLWFRQAKLCRCDQFLICPFSCNPHFQLLRFDSNSFKRNGPSANRTLFLFGDYTFFKMRLMLFCVLYLHAHKGATMKRTFIRLILAAAMLLTASASTSARADGGGLPPMCKPGQPQCPVIVG